MVAAIVIYSVLVFLLGLAIGLIIGLNKCAKEMARLKKKYGKETEIIYQSNR